MELHLLVLENGRCAGVGIVEQLLHGRVHFAPLLIRERAVRLAVDKHGHRRVVDAHAALHDHLAGYLCGLLQVRHAPRRHVVGTIDELLGSLAPHQQVQPSLQLEQTLRITLRGRDLPCDSESVSARHDGCLVDRVGALGVEGDERVAALVVGRHPLLLLTHRIAALQTNNDAVKCLLEVLHWYVWPPLCRRLDGGDVDDVEQVRTRHARRPPRHHVHVHVLAQYHARPVHLQDLVSACEVGERHDDVLVEASRPGERRVKRLWEVGGTDHNHSLVLLKTVKLHEQLVERHPDGGVVPVGPLGAHGIDLVYKHDTRGVLLGSTKQIPNTTGTDADEHFFEF
mmetsp:Transcript_4333/g.11422  ORF Transcript_4333/g.11422 Transcript_4333/m.11422 type:complete len:341 (-) Transcript_4333:1198-2220(-)